MDAYNEGPSVSSTEVGYRAVLKSWAPGCVNVADKAAEVASNSKNKIHQTWGPSCIRFYQRFIMLQVTSWSVMKRNTEYISIITASIHETFPLF